MNTFRKRVIAHLQREGWHIKYSTNPLIDFYSVRPDTHIQKAYRVKSHGHLKKAEVTALKEYGKVHNMHILYIHESTGHEIEFVRLYPRNR